MSKADDFVLVTRSGRRRKGRRNLTGSATSPSAIAEQDREVDHETLLRKQQGRNCTLCYMVYVTGKHAHRSELIILQTYTDIQHTPIKNFQELEKDETTLDRTVIEVRDAPFTRLIFSQLTESLVALSSDGVSEIVCYGLGQFSQSRSSRYQLAFLLCLKVRHEPAHVHVYDPAFRLEEVRALRTLGLEVIEMNEEGKRIIQRDRTTLVYMPHCSRQLTNNFLYANWGDGLSGCILLANSLSATVDDCLRRDVLNTAGYMLRIRPYVTEIRLENSFVYEEVFNDLSIHIFARQDLLKVPEGFWSSREEPRYLTKDVEFVTAAQ